MHFRSPYVRLTSDTCGRRAVRVPAAVATRPNARHNAWGLLPSRAPPAPTENSEPPGRGARLRSSAAALGEPAERSLDAAPSTAGEGIVFFWTCHRDITTDRRRFSHPDRRPLHGFRPRRTHRTGVAAAGRALRRRPPRADRATRGGATNTPSKRTSLNNETRRAATVHRLRWPQPVRRGGAATARAGVSAEDGEGDAARPHRHGGHRGRCARPRTTRSPRCLRGAGKRSRRVGAPQSRRPDGKRLKTRHRRRGVP